MTDAEIREVVNELRKIAKNFCYTQQLRERISSYIVPILKAARATPADHIVDANKKVDAHSVPVAWITKEQLSQLTDLTADAWVYWRESGHVAEDDEIALYAQPPQPEAQSVRDAVFEKCASMAECYDLGTAEGHAIAAAIRALKSAPPVSDEVKP